MVDVVIVWPDEACAYIQARQCKGSFKSQVVNVSLSTRRVAGGKKGVGCSIAVPCETWRLSIWGCFTIWTISTLRKFVRRESCH